MEQRTHLRIDAELCGRTESLDDGTAEVALVATDRMAADERGLVHGGFPFGLADYAAMLAVNDPHVVLGGAVVKFVRPVVAGDELRARAVLEWTEGKKRRVSVVVRRNGEPVLEGEFLCIVPERHILDGPSRADEP